MSDQALSAALEALDNAAIALDHMARKGIRDTADFDALVALERSCAPEAHALTLYYAQAKSLAVETEERLWQTVSGHHQAIARAYRQCFERHAEDPACYGQAHALPELLVGLADHMRCITLWQYLRYQPAVPGFWLELHKIYQCAEQNDCTETAVTRPQGDLSVGAVYVQALMLDMLNRTNMLKREIVMVASWLQDWGQLAHIERHYLPERHLFYVNLEEDRGGRRVRNVEPRSHYRYWEADGIVEKLAQASAALARGVLPNGLALLSGETSVELQHLITQVQGEWSRHDYRRQRRAQMREEVVKRAQVVNGILNVCQHVKNVAIAGRKDMQALSDGLAMTDDQEKWVIENESHNGFGAVVDADLNLWLHPGKLIALDYEFNRDITVVGVVRSLQKLPENKLRVGIEVLSHTPAYVRMRLLSGQNAPQDLLTTATFSSPLDLQGAPPFSALYLPRDEILNSHSTLLLPVLDFVVDGHYELRWERHNYRVRLGRVVEQKDDWVRVEALLEGRLN